MLKVKRIMATSKLPTIAHSGEDLGYDVYAAETITLNVFPQKVRLGIAVECLGPNAEPMGLLMEDRSSLGMEGVQLACRIIDAGYRGSITAVMFTLKGKYTITRGQKIAQMIPQPVIADRVVEVEELEESSRGDKGFGSSDIANAERLVTGHDE
jgi:dUTP pyrophosphatase